ncbi:energy-coupling factor ABC transporter ATP-binding protein [Entomospira culicis]|uniref:ABC transporter ATP-binding protein n=1 Tax=Entomospira culicis TaxID=2719989 RepID=A0A968GJ38_9SPIO|nr:ABC transporter ATP-binding protein [Entomospira culicis]NIZ18570.1 ABC transporter ATP-binding protein [Entomospira culicis]NIZ68785.1 ABC transporter ATP-binding protein [Entomospira culicis]WDI37381.1 ABC transporter ATP-binding protein [Entomospira culicis]WDI39010.1 ABC transporter ATP-binding protein [Entomospira culicis]
MPLLTLNRLSKSYEKKCILDALSMTLPHRSCAILAGACGSGKSLLLRLIADLEKPDSGAITLDTEHQTKPKGKTKYRSVSLLMQSVESQLLGQSVWDDLYLHPMLAGESNDEAKRITEEALRHFGLWHIRHQAPHTLSGGQMRLLLLAGIFTHRSALILLDEPFANLDYTAVKQVRSGIELLLKAGKSVIIATHEVEKVISLANYLLILSEKKIALERPLTEKNRDQIPWQDFDLKDPYAPAWQW